MTPEAAATPAPAVRALNCPQCGAALIVRATGQTVAIVCSHCLSILDARDPKLKILQEFKARTRVEPLIPMGTRGDWRGTVFEAIGFQIRTITVEGIDYSWAEYLLFNPYEGFRYFTEYNGHWNDVKPLRAMPKRTVARGHPAVAVLGKTFKHFQTAEARTTYVVGEFPWQVRVGETATVEDFVAPPLIVSAETTEGETTWSIGEYIEGTRVWQAFRLAGSPPSVRGVYANQPSPTSGSAGELWGLCLLFLGLLALMAVGFWTFALQQEVFDQYYTFARQTGEEPSFVTDVFELKGRPSDVELSVHSDLSNSWVYFDFALINEQTGEAYNFGREVSYYHGYDSDGSWTEGSPDDRVLIPTVPAGRYYLRVEPELDPRQPRVTYTLRIRRDVPTREFFLVAAILLAVPPTFNTLRGISFESARWKESDHAPSQRSDDDGD